MMIILRDSTAKEIKNLHRRRTDWNVIRLTTAVKSGLRERESILPEGEYEFIKLGLVLFKQ